MDPKKLQKEIDKALEILSDHDDKKHETRYKNLRSYIEESQQYIEQKNYQNDITLELYNDLKNGIKEFEEDRWIFIIFLIILCGLLFIGVFYITYAHFYDIFHYGTGGDVNPPVSTTTISKSPIIDDETTTTTAGYNKTTTTTTSTTPSVTITIPSEEEESTTGFVTVIFDNSSLIDLVNLYPVDDADGLISTPTKWSLSSELTRASRDYEVTYTISFVDKIDAIVPGNLMDINKLKFQLLIKKAGNQLYDTGVQFLKDYPEIIDGSRPIITNTTPGNIFRNGETLDFELRMWLDSATDNSQQGKEYKFSIFVEATYDFIE